MMDLAGAKLLVVGGAGFIGSHLVEELLTLDVSKILVYDNLTSGSRGNLSNSLKDSRCRIVHGSGDILDFEALSSSMEGVDGVFHLAGLWLLHCRELPREAFNVNIAGTFNVLEACVKSGVKRLIFSSSASVYGDAEEVPMTESHPFNNRNFYGATKIAGEAMCRAYFDRYGLNYLGLRYMNVYGPRQNNHNAYSGVIPAILKNLSIDQRPIINGDGTQSYDFVHVSDVARANRLAMESDMTNDYLNVGTGVSTSIKDLIEIILEESGSGARPRYRPYKKSDLRQLVQHRVGCPELAKQKIDYSYQVELRNGLRELIKLHKHDEK